MGVAAKTTKKVPVKAKDGKAPKSKEVASDKPPTKSSHPPTSEMVNAAIDALKDRKGSSVQAIKKYISGKYLVDIERLAPFIKKYLKLAVEKNILVQTTGVGASGRFKLAITAPVKSVKPIPEKQSTASEKPQLPSKVKKSGKAPAAKTKSPKSKKIRTN